MRHYNVELVVEHSRTISQEPKGKKWPCAQAISEQLEGQGIYISAQTLYNQSEKAPGVAPNNVGGQFFNQQFEKDMAAGIRYFRELELPVFKDDVLETVRVAIIDCELDHLLEDGVVTDGWYYRFLARNKLNTGNFQPIETSRAEWCTPENMKKYYDIAAQVFLDAGIAEKNPKYDPDVPYDFTKPYDAQPLECQPVIVTKPHRLASYDETDATLDQTDKSKKNTDRIILGGKDDTGAVKATKSSVKITLVGGRIGKNALPAYVNFGTGDSHQAHWGRNPPMANVVKGADGKKVEPIIAHSKTGAMNSERCLDYTKKILMPAMFGISAEEGNGGVEVCDGCNVHLSYPRLQYAREHGLRVLLRVPHTSDKTQGEDTVIFRLFKPAYRRAKAAKFRDLMTENGERSVNLTLDHFMVGLC